MRHYLFLFLISLPLWALASFLQSQPVNVPNQNYGTFNSTDLDVTLDEASGQNSQSGWESLTGAGMDQLLASWEVPTDAQIDAAVLGISHADYFNANPEYHHYIRSMLELQAAEQRAGYQYDASLAVDAERPEFIAALSEDIRRKIEDDRVDQLRTFDGQAGANTEAHNFAYNTWLRDFQSEFANGMRQFQSAFSALDERLSGFDNGIAARDAKFQQDLRRIDQAEATVRVGI